MRKPRFDRVAAENIDRAATRAASGDSTKGSARASLKKITTIEQAMRASRGLSGSDI